MTLTVQRISRRTVGVWLRERRQRLQLSQTQVAREAGITQGSLSNYETGKRELGIDTLLRLSSAVDADLGELIGTDETIVLQGSRLAAAASALQQAPELLDRIVGPDGESGREIVGHAEFVPSTRELTWSDDYARILGLEPGTVTPSIELFYERLHPDDIEPFKEYSAKLTAGLSHVRAFDLRFVIPETGETRYVRTQSRAEYDGDGTPLVLHGIMRYRVPD